MEKPDGVKSILFMLEGMSAEQIEEALEAVWRVYTHGAGAAPSTGNSARENKGGRDHDGSGTAIYNTAIYKGRAGGA